MRRNAGGGKATGGVHFQTHQRQRHQARLASGPSSTACTAGSLASTDEIKFIASSSSNASVAVSFPDSISAQASTMAAAASIELSSPSLRRRRSLARRKSSRAVTVACWRRTSSMPGALGEAQQGVGRQRILGGGVGRRVGGIRPGLVQGQQAERLLARPEARLQVGGKPHGRLG